MPHRTESKPFRQIKYDMEGKCGNPPSFEKFWFDMHKIGLDKPKAMEKYEKIKKTVQENPEMEVFDVVKECFGHQNKGHVAGFGGAIKPKDIRGALPSRFDLMKKLKQAEKANEALLGRLKDVEVQNGTLLTRLNEVEAKFDLKLQPLLDTFG